MTIKRAFDLEGSEISLVQNRLNVAALALTALVFSGSFSFNLFGSFRSQDAAAAQAVAAARAAVDAQAIREYRQDFLYLLVALALGITASLASILCFLQSQQSPREGGWEPDEYPRPVWAGPAWLHTRQWWFCLGQLFLYAALTQATTASLQEVVYGVGLTRPLRPWAIVLGAMALPIWWGLLFAGPFTLLRRMSPFQSRAEQWASSGVYFVLLAAVIAVPAAAYSAQGGGSFLRSVFEQVFQPLTWYRSWGE